MTHPVEHLVDFVDGTLPARERAVVRAHLQTCARCRDEVALSSAAKRALAEVPDVQAPAGLGAEAARRAEGGGPEVSPEVASLTQRRDRTATSGAPAWYRWGIAAAGIAAAMLVAVVILPKVGGDGDAVPAAAPAAESSGGSGDAGFTAADRVVRQQRDYDISDVQALARTYASITAPPPAAEDRGAEDGSDPAPAATGADVPGALACLEQAFPDLAGAGPPVSLIEARFQGTPAYFGVYASGPGAGEDADTITVWIAASDDCSILHTTQRRI